jgi:hypothetical protein
MDVTEKVKIEKSKKAYELKIKCTFWVILTGSWRPHYYRYEIFRDWFTKTYIIIPVPVPVIPYRWNRRGSVPQNPPTVTLCRCVNWMRVCCNCPGPLDFLAGNLHKRD